MRLLLMSLGSALVLLLPRTGHALATNNSNNNKNYYYDKNNNYNNYKNNKNNDMNNIDAKEAKIVKLSIDGALEERRKNLKKGSLTPEQQAYEKAQQEYQRQYNQMQQQPSPPINGNYYSPQDPDWVQERRRYEERQQGIAKARDYTPPPPSAPPNNMNMNMNMNMNTDNQRPDIDAREQRRQAEWDRHMRLLRNGQPPPNPPYPPMGPPRGARRPRPSFSSSAFPRRPPPPPPLPGRGLGRPPRRRAPPPPPPGPWAWQERRMRRGPPPPFFPPWDAPPPPPPPPRNNNQMTFDAVVSQADYVPQLQQPQQQQQQQKQNQVGPTPTAQDRATKNTQNANSAPFDVDYDRLDDDDYRKGPNFYRNAGKLQEMQSPTPSQSNTPPPRTQQGTYKDVSWIARGNSDPFRPTQTQTTAAQIQSQRTKPKNLTKNKDSSRMDGVPPLQNDWQDKELVSSRDATFANSNWDQNKVMAAAAAVGLGLPLSIYAAMNHLPSISAFGNAKTNWQLEQVLKNTPQPLNKVPNSKSVEWGGKRTPASSPTKASSATTSTTTTSSSNDNNNNAQSAPATLVKQSVVTNPAVPASTSPPAEIKRETPPAETAPAQQAEQTTTEADAVTRSAPSAATQTTAVPPATTTISGSTSQTMAPQTLPQSIAEKYGLVTPGVSPTPYAPTASTPTKSITINKPVSTTESTPMNDRTANLPPSTTRQQATPASSSSTTAITAWSDPAEGEISFGAISSQMHPDMPSVFGSGG